MSTSEFTKKKIIICPRFNTHTELLYKLALSYKKKKTNCTVSQSLCILFIHYESQQSWSQFQAHSRFDLVHMALDVGENQSNQGSPQMHRGDSGIEPRTILLLDDSANYTTMPLYTIIFCPTFFTNVTNVVTNLCSLQLI